MKRRTTERLYKSRYNYTVFQDYRLPRDFPDLTFRIVRIFVLLLYAENIEIITSPTPTTIIF